MTFTPQFGYTNGKFIVGNGLTTPFGSSTFLYESATGVGVGRVPSAGFLLDVAVNSGTLNSRFVNLGTTATDIISLSLRTLSTGATASTITINFGDGDSTTVGGIIYAHGTDSMIFRVNALNRFTIDNGGSGRFLGGVTSASPTVGVGYATGAGGAITQITSRTTGVTLNNACGQITLFSATTTAGQTSSIVVTNSSVSVGDVIFISQQTGSGIYFFTTKAAAGSFTLSIYTPAAVAVAEAPVLNFAVIKSVAA